jgi:hypothetical protein
VEEEEGAEEIGRDKRKGMMMPAEEEALAPKSIVKCVPLVVNRSMRPEEIS